MAIMFLTISANAEGLVENRGNHHVIHWWRVVQGNNGEIPLDGFVCGYNKSGEQIIRIWDVAKMGATQPSYATLNSYSSVSAATCIDYKKMRKADYTKWNDREKAMLRMYRNELKKIFTLLKAIGATNAVPTYSRDEMEALLKAVM